MKVILLFIVVGLVNLMLAEEIKPSTKFSKEIKEFIDREMQKKEGFEHKAVGEWKYLYSSKESEKEKYKVFYMGKMLLKVFDEKTDVKNKFNLQYVWFSGPAGEAKGFYQIVKIKDVLSYAPMNYLEWTLLRTNTPHPNSPVMYHAMLTSHNAGIRGGVCEVSVPWGMSHSHLATSPRMYTGCAR